MGALKNVYAKDLGFSVAPFINASSRMSEVINENGAQRLFNTLVNDARDYNGLKDILFFKEVNESRIKRMNEIKASDEYINTIKRERYSDDKVVIYELAEGEPHAFCGLAAGSLCEAIDKPVLCVVKKTDDKGNVFYQGSGRNAEGFPPLNEFLNSVSAEMKAIGQTLECGGHADAIGISNLNDLLTFKEIVRDFSRDFVREKREQTILAFTPADIIKEDTVDRLTALEPLGTGLTVPPILVEGNIEEIKDMGNPPHPIWKTLAVDGGFAGFRITDWAYEPKEFSTENNKFLADISISQFGGAPHIDLSVKFNSDMIERQLGEISVDMAR